MIVKGKLPEFSCRDWGNPRRPSAIVLVATSIPACRFLYTRPQHLHRLVWPAPLGVTWPFPLLLWLVFHVGGDGSYLTLTTVDLHGPGSSVGIATGYGLDGPGIESRWGARFSAPVQTGPGAQPASCAIGYRVFPGGKHWPGRDVDPSPPF